MYQVSVYDIPLKLNTFGVRLKQTKVDLAGVKSGCLFVIGDNAQCVVLTDGKDQFDFINTPELIVVPFEMVRDATTKALRFSVVKIRVYRVNNRCAIRRSKPQLYCARIPKIPHWMQVFRQIELLLPESNK